MMDIRALMLLLHCTAVTVSQSCSDGAVEIFGVETGTLIAGRLEICVDGQWFAVYDGMWGDDEAEVVCREKGFDCATHCGDSCFGTSQLSQGYRRFECNGEESALNDCSGRQPQSAPNQTNNAGVICRNTTAQATSQCRVIPGLENMITTLTTIPDMTTPPKCDCISTTSNTVSDFMTEANNMMRESKSNCTAATAVLGALSAIQFFTLVGVVLGWVWTCHRNRDRVKQKPNKIDNTLNNPTYAPITPLTTSPYSMLGPRDAPQAGHTPSSREEGEVTEDNYEVPVQGQRNSETYEGAERYEMAPAQDYNKLQHL